MDSSSVIHEDSLVDFFVAIIEVPFPMWRGKGVIVKALIRGFAFTTSLSSFLKLCSANRANVEGP